MKHGKPRRRAFTGLPIIQTVRKPGPETAADFNSDFGADFLADAGNSSVKVTAERCYYHSIVGIKHF